MTLADLFPEESYRFHMRFERGSVGEFFRPTEAQDVLIAQRRHWLATAPDTYAALLPDGIPLLDETVSLAQSEQTLPRGDFMPLVNSVDARQRCLALGAAWEPDFLLLKRDHDERIRLLAGCVCFPSSWSLTEKIGHPIESIHDVVPGLNPAIGNAIQTFLSRLRPGPAWLRANWGLSRSPELNQHPDRRLPRLDAGASLDEIWLRIEYQALIALPLTQGILFGIRIAVHPLAQLRNDAALGPRFLHALRTMPEPVAQYKGIARVRETILRHFGA
jgi:dimethylamine monooxygenase subunit A